MTHAEPSDTPGGPTCATPYEDAHSHLRDELWRVWLRVEYQIRSGWEAGALPRVSDDSAVGVSTPGTTARLGRAREGGTDAGAARVLEAFLRHSERIEARVAASLGAGVDLPLIRVARRFELSPRQRAALTFALMPEVDPNLLTAYRYLSH